MLQYLSSEELYNIIRRSVLNSLKKQFSTLIIVCFIENLSLFCPCGGLLLCHYSGQFKYGQATVKKTCNTH